MSRNLGAFFEPKVDFRTEFHSHSLTQLTALLTCREQFSSLLNRRTDNVCHFALRPSADTGDGEWWVVSGEWWVVSGALARVMQWTYTTRWVWRPSEWANKWSESVTAWDVNSIINMLPWDPAGGGALVMIEWSLGQSDGHLSSRELHVTVTLSLVKTLMNKVSSV